MKTTPISIALVDDYLPGRKILGSYLASQRFAVACEAGNGQELLSKLIKIDRIPEMCLLDINMPVMDGFETARALKNKYPTINVLCYSTSDDKRSVKKILECGADAFVCKDGCPEEIRNALVILYNSTTPGMSAQTTLA